MSHISYTIWYMYMITEHAGLRLTNTNIFVTNNNKSLPTSEPNLFISTHLPANQQ
ncbi:hypothetical protein CBL_13375 [Carabus blaptoides fortunei]